MFSAVSALTLCTDCWVLSVEFRLEYNQFCLLAESISFEPYIAGVRRLAETIPKLKPYLPNIIRILEEGEDAVNSEDKDALLKVLREGIEEIKKITPLLKSNPTLHALALIAPSIAEYVEDGVENGDLSVKDLINLVKYYGKLFLEGSDSD